MLALLAQLIPRVPSVDVRSVPLKGNPMPTFHAHIPAGKFSSAEKRALAVAFHRSLIEAFGTPPGDNFNMISEHNEDELFMDPHFPGMNRTERAMIVTLVHGAHRPLEQKRKVAELVSRYAVEAVGISRDDIVLIISPVDNENFSFGRGELQLAGIPPKW
jgi:phenylpyruvate tautomerase PptA (4-oxalocrotonate tautomerase family)